MSYTLIILAIAPALAFCGYVIHKDRFNKEPKWLMLLAFGFGVFSVFPAGISSVMGSQMFDVSGSFINTGLYAFLVVALSEEFAKFFFLRYILFKREEFNEPLDGVVYAVMIGMGFAAFENILYVSTGGVGVALLRMVTAIPAHAIFAVVMGYYVGLAKFDLTHRSELIRKGLLYPILLHGAYDFFLLQKNIPLLSLLAFVGLWFSGKQILYILKQSSDNSSLNGGSQI
ncbi:MAG TPA: PrsW family glutamic-type intramembrane protease [Chitinophagales bacterium]|nr:PrsW family glutamic-type intramembrane protease [Chitinophagales bacterium]